MFTANYIGAIPLLHSALKELDRKAAELSKKWEELKSVVEGLAAKVEKLIAQVTGHGEAIKKLQAANDNLERSNAALVKRIEALEAKFKAANDNEARPAHKAAVNRKE